MKGNKRLPEVEAVVKALIKMYRDPAIDVIKAINPYLNVQNLAPAWAQGHVGIVRIKASLPCMNVNQIIRLDYAADRDVGFIDGEANTLRFQSMSISQSMSIMEEESRTIHTASWSIDDPDGERKFTEALQETFK